jgi:NADPH:quinone reductase-like Zn-dependent oxidoreductase
MTTHTETMKAVVATGYGNPDVFEVREVSKPSPKPNEVLVKVMTSAVTTADTMMRTGKPYIGRLFTGISKPKKSIPGTGFAGVVENTGAEVTNFKTGDRVFGETAFGFSSNAEYLVIEEGGVMLKMAENMSFEESANFCDGHLTSYNFLKKLHHIEKGQKVLINGASGSLGSSAVQIAKHLGAHVTAVCGSKNIGLVKSLGADEAINYHENDFTQMTNSFDVIYDTVGKSSFKKCKNVLTEKGVYLSPVLGLSLLGSMIWTSVFGNKKAKFEATGTNKADKLRTLLAEVLEIYKAGKLKTIIDRQYPLEKLSEAHLYIDQGHKKGNIVLINY